MKKINILTILIPAALFGLGLFFFYLAGIVPNPVYPDIQPEDIQKMSFEHKEALRSCQLDKIWRERGYTPSKKYIKSVMERSNEFWERRYLMYQDGYWCNRFEARRYVQPSGTSWSPFDGLEAWLAKALY
jgi:hypothetical protein